MAEQVCPQELPDILDRVQLGGIGRQRYQGDVLWDDQTASGLVPSGAVEDENGVSAGCDAAADLGKVKAHQLGIDRRQYKRCASAPCRADGAEDIDPVMALIAWRRRPGTPASLDPRQPTLLADPGLILEPDFQRLAAGSGRQPFAHRGGEVFLNAS